MSLSVKGIKWKANGSGGRGGCIIIAEQLEDVIRDNGERLVMANLVSRTPSSPSRTQLHAQ